MAKPSSTNRPNASLVSFYYVSFFLRCIFSLTIVKPYLGGFSSEVPPLPIPNREVKLAYADGTALPGGRVGSRRF